MTTMTIAVCNPFFCCICVHACPHLRVRFQAPVDTLAERQAGAKQRNLRGRRALWVEDCMGQKRRAMIEKKMRTSPQLIISDLHKQQGYDSKEGSGCLRACTRVGNQNARAVGDRKHQPEGFTNSGSSRFGDRLPTTTNSSHYHSAPTQRRVSLPNFLPLLFL